MKMVKIRLIIVASILMVMIFLAFFCRFLFRESIMEKYTTVDQLKRSDVRVDDWIPMDMVAGWEAEGMKITKEEQLDMYFDYCTEQPNALIVEPTGNIKCTYFAIFQEMEIKQVLRGDAKPGDVAQCILEGSRIETRNNDSFLMTYGANLMQPGKQYLMFCQDCDMSNYSSYDYYVSDSGLVYYELSDDNVAVSVAEDNHYSELCSYEFFGGDEETAAAIIEFKKNLMSRLKKTYALEG